MMDKAYKILIFGQIRRYPGDKETINTILSHIDVYFNLTL